MSSTARTTNPGDRSAAEIEREVERTRARLTGTVEELKERVSPGQMAEQAMDWLRGSGGREFLGNLGTSVRDNPMPVLLIAAGIGWLAMSGRGDTRPRYGTRDNWTGSYPGESYPPETYAGQGLHGDTGPSVGERAGEAARGLRDAAGDMAQRAGDTLHGARGAARSLAEGASDAGRRAARRAGEAWHSASDTASDLGARASWYGERARTGLASTFEEQPLLLGAFGLAIGAALGALLPASETEDELMGETRDRVAERASALANEAYQDARQKLEERGLTPERGAAALGEVARDLRETVERGAQQARETTERGADQAEEAARRETGSRDTGSRETGTGPATSTPSSAGTPPAGSSPMGGPPASGIPPTGSTGGGPSATGIPRSRSGPQSGGPV